MESPNFQTALVAIGLMTMLCPDEFADTVKTTISTFIVKDLLMKDQVTFDVLPTSYDNYSTKYLNT